jgi:hypothetical protein
MSLFRHARKQELAQLRAGGWTVTTEGPVIRARHALAARRARRIVRAAGPECGGSWAGWSR